MWRRIESNVVQVMSHSFVVFSTKGIARLTKVSKLPDKGLEETRRPLATPETLDAFRYSPHHGGVRRNESLSRPKHSLVGQAVDSSRGSGYTISRAVVLNSADRIHEPTSDARN